MTNHETRPNNEQEDYIGRTHHVSKIIQTKLNLLVRPTANLKHYVL